MKIIALILGVGIGYFIANRKTKCNHNWKLYESGNIFNKDRYGEKIVIGFIKVYECEHCKKMRKEQVVLKD